MKHHLARAGKHDGGVVRIEPLEGRTLFAGDVTAVLDGFVVVITGDSASNQFDVSSDDHTGLVIVTPLQDTTINGSTMPVAFDAHVNVLIATGNGDDVVYLREFDLQDAIVSTGNGKDSVIADSNLFFNLTIETGGGSDEVTGPTTVGRTLHIDTGNASDTITFALSRNLEVKSPSTIDGGKGSDVLDLRGNGGFILPAKVQILDIEDILE
jgi:hypothetical protein